MTRQLYFSRRLFLIAWHDDASRRERLLCNGKANL